MLARLLLVLFLLGPAWAAYAADDTDLLPVEEAFRISAAADSATRLRFEFAIAPGYYLYRHRLGVSLLGHEVELPAFEVPDGIAYEDEFFGAVETYRDQLLLTQALPASLAGAGQSLRVELRHQGCADIGICYPPQKTVLTVALPASEGLSPAMAATGGGLNLSAPPAFGSAGFGSSAADQALPEDQAFRVEAIATSSDQILLRVQVAPGYYLYRDKTVLSTSSPGIALGQPQWPPAQPYEDAHFGQVMVYFESFEAPLALARDNQAAHSIRIDAEYQGCKDQGICYPVMRRSLTLELPQGAGAQLPVADSGGAEVGAGLGLAGALLFALLGGLILNLMPCVLPILSLKAIGLAKSGHGQAYARRHALWYTAGVVLSFALLGMALVALRASGEALGWGFQLQQPLFVGVLVYVMLAVGLSLSGVVAFGASWGGLGQSLTEDEGPRGAFFTGVLASVVASPCTAPLMGGAMAFAVAQPAAIAVLVFVMLGLGLALPFLLIGFVPALAQSLPRPGPWMETLKQTLAFPMYLTGVWLLWVLGHQVGMDGAGALLAGGVALAMALWWWERQRDRRAGPRWVGVLVLLALAAWPLHFVASLDAPAKSATARTDSAEVYSEQRLAQLRAEGKAVLVNMTADWCATCKLNERLVLSSDRFHALLAETGTVYLKGDWTNEDPAITAFLQRFKAVGVPLYVVFPAHGGDPLVLPTVLTSATVERALR